VPDFSVLDKLLFTYLLNYFLTYLHKSSYNVKAVLLRTAA